MGLMDRLRQAEEEIQLLRQQINDILLNTQEGKTPPTTLTGTKQPPIGPCGTKTGMGIAGGSPVIFNDSELARPPRNVKPPTPTEGYNCHSHSRYAGGALDINTLELVEYDISVDADGNWIDSTYNQHCQDFWKTIPDIATTQNSSNNNIEKIGRLALTFNADTKKWEVTGTSEINIKTTYLVEYASDGKVAKDDNGVEKKAPLWNADATKSCIVWDKNAQCWRFYATFANYLSET